MIKLLAVCSLLSLSLAMPVRAQEETDAEGCKDSPALSRMKGCIISECTKQDFDRAAIRTGPGEEQTQAVEGEIETITYECSEKVSKLSIVRNAENALKGAGYKTVYSGVDVSEFPVYSARKGGVWVDVASAHNHIYTVVVARTKEMEQQMVATAEEMEADITSSGSCSIYGVLFDTGKASIKPESDRCLGEVARLLKKNSSWKMRIEGHTDNVGSRAANMTLSQERADSVRSWLVSHGIEAARLTAKGLGDTKPVAQNSSESGRGKNRRVTLVKM